MEKIKKLIGLTTKLPLREHFLLALVLVLPLIFNPFNGDIEFVKITVLIVAAIALFMSNPLFEVKNKFLGYTLAILAITAIAATFLAKDQALAFAGSYYRQFGLTTWLAGILFALLSCQIFANKTSREKLLKTLSISGTLTAIFAFALFYMVSVGFEGRISGTLGNPNVLGKLLVVSLITSFFQAKSAKHKTFWLGSIAIQLAALMATGNRGSWLALAIVALLYLTQTKKDHVLRAIGGLGVITASVSILFWERISSFVSIQTRAELLIAGTKAFFKSPFHGYGFDQIEYALNLPNYTLIPDRAHQIFLDAGLTMGVFGMAALIALSLGAICVLFKSKENTLRASGFALLALTLSLQVSFFTSVSFFVFWVLIGLALNQSTRLRFLRS